MRVLVVATHFPFPPRFGSDVVAVNTLPLLARNHELHLVSLCEEPDAQVPAGLFNSVKLVRRRPPSPLELRVRAAAGLARGMPITVALGESREMCEAVAAAAGRTAFDALLLFELSAIQYCPPGVHRKIVANLEDPPALKLWRKLSLDVYRPWQRPRIALNALLNLRYERSVLPSLASALVLSEEDAEAMRRSGHRNIGFVPYGTAPIEASKVPPFEARRAGMIVISGNMFHLPNVDGVLHFCAEVLPLVLRDCPEAIVHLVGGEPDRRLLTLARRSRGRVVATGRVPEIAAYLRQARVSVCPVRLRIGVQTKILEALASGTPVVSTLEGNSGIRGVSGVHLWAENEPRRFARRIVDLLQGKDWELLSKSGLEFVASRFSWEASVAHLEQHLKAV